MSKTCSVEGCNGKHVAKGYCRKHYMQFKRHGNIAERTTYDVNEIIECDNYAELVLYDKQCEEIARAVIDLEYVDIVKQYKWGLTHGYVWNTQVGRLHRFIMNPPEGMVVDHINHNPLDNRRENLRVCTQHQNTMNHSIQSNNTSGITGVCWDKNNNKWMAYIRLNGRNKHLGRYNTIEEAADARKRAEIEYFGEYAPNKE